MIVNCILLTLTQACKLNGSQYENKILEVKPAEVGQNQPSNGQIFSLFIQNLSFKTSDKKIMSLFEKCGEITSVRLPVHKDTGKKTGYEYIFV